MIHSQHPLNAPGDFYVEDGLCLACQAPEHEAPDLIGHCVDSYHCYFKRQPVTPEETLLAVRAVQVGCCGAVRYGGADRNILSRLGPSDDCDITEIDRE
jgi:hypothetical protein